MQRVEGVQARGGEVGQGVGVAGPLQGLWFPSWSVLVVGVVVHVLSSDSLGLVNERPFLSFSQHFPLGSEPAGNF